MSPVAATEWVYCWVLLFAFYLLVSESFGSEMRVDFELGSTKNEWGAKFHPHSPLFPLDFQGKKEKENSSFSPPRKMGVFGTFFQFVLKIKIKKAVLQGFIAFLVNHIKFSLATR